MTTSNSPNLQQIAAEVQKHKISETQAIIDANKYANTHPSSVESAASSVESSVGGVVGGIGSIATFITSGKNWLRMGEVLAGVILIVMGLRTLAGHDTTPVSVTTGAAKAAARGVR